MNVRVPSLVLAVCMALTGCASVHAGAHEAPPLVVVLFDVSRSTRDVRGDYEGAFARVLDYVARSNGTIVADVIDENPLAHAGYPIDATFRGCDAWTDNPLLCAARTKRLTEQVSVEARTILHAPPGRAGTDLHDALRLAQRVFDAYPDAGPRSLVVLSDMLECSPTLNVIGASRPDRVDASLDALQAGDEIADLTGVTVTVVGAGVSSGRDLPAERILAVQRFWEAYFDRAGATLPPDRYGSALIRFP